MNWLKNLRPPKIYRYFFYRQFILSKSLWDIQPAFSSLIGSTITILFHVFFVILGFGALLDINVWGKLFHNVSPLPILGFYFLALFVAYFLFYHNGKWLSIIEEFQNETKEQQVKGKYYLFIYLFISLIVMLRIMLWFIELTSPYAVNNS